MQRGRYTWGYNWEVGITSSPAYYDPVGNPDNLAQSSFIMANFDGGFYGTYALGKQCRELGLKFTGTQAIPFSTPRDRIRNKSVMKLLQKVLKGGQTKDKEC